jgi:hypothetical protein
MAVTRTRFVVGSTLVCAALCAVVLPNTSVIAGAAIGAVGGVLNGFAQWSAWGDKWQSR